MKKTHLKQPVFEAISACQEKKAEQIAILELDPGSGAFTDYFVVCSGTNPRQVQAISDEVEERGARIFGEGAQLLRPGTALEIGETARSRRSHHRDDQKKRAPVRPLRKKRA